MKTREGKATGSEIVGKKFVEWYNNEHRHREITYVTPSERHSGRDKELLQKRKSYMSRQETHIRGVGREIRENGNLAT